MKTLMIPKSFRHSVIEYFDRMIQQGRVESYFVGHIPTKSFHFPLAYKVCRGLDDIPVAHFDPLFMPEFELEIRTVGDIDPIENLKDALAHISMGNRVKEQQDGIAAIMDYCCISLSIIDFEGKGHFKVEPELEWR